MEKRQTSAWIFVVCVLGVLFGAYLRCTHVDTKVFFDDELATSVHVAGYTLDDFRDPRRFALSSAGTVISADHIRQRFEGPGSGRGLWKATQVLAYDDPQHPPLYYVAEWEWQRFFGDSVSARRSLAVVAGILLLPAIFWLTLELFGSMGAAAVAAALVAVSPFQLVYAQQAREYSLFALLTVLSATALLRALRTDRRTWWIAYGAMLVMAFYTQILALFVGASFVVYALAVRRYRSRSTMVPFLAATSVAAVACIPWLVVLASRLHHAEDSNVWMAVRLPLGLYIAKVGFGIGTIFFDGEYLQLRLALLLLVAIAVATCAVIAAFRGLRQGDAVALPIAIIVVNLVAMIGSDIVLGASRSTAVRYFLPLVVGVELLVAYGLGRSITSNRTVTRRLASFGAVAILALGGFSCWIADRQAVWWTNNTFAPLAKAARYVDATPGAVVLTTPIHALQLSNLTRSDPQFALDVHSAETVLTDNLYAVDMPPDVVQDMGSRINAELSALDLSVSEQQALKSIHSQVSQVHRGSGQGTEQDTLAWRIVRRRAQ